MKSVFGSRFFIRSPLILSALLHFIHLPGTSARPSITIQPKYAHINSSQSVIVTCNADESLVGCQFYRDGAVMDLSQGAASRPPTGSYYQGSGLKAGHCGLVITGFTTGYAYSIGCRVRSKTGGWVYDVMTVFADDDVRSLDVVADPPGDTVVLPGGNLTLMHRLTSPNFTLSECQYKLFNNWHSLNKGVDSARTDEYAYYGAGLQKGECGIQLFNVTDKYNGFRRVFLRVTSPVTEATIIEVSTIVAKPPDSPELLFTANVLTEGDTLTATCTAKNSRPVANITWYLGNEVIRSDKDDESPISQDWRWSHSEQSISQSISRTVTLDDHGKSLICQIEHPALKNQGIINRSHVITVKYKPRGTPKKQVQQRDLQPGYPGVVSIFTSHTSEPTLFWVTGDVIIKQGESDVTGRLHAAKAVKEGDNWRAQLLISNVTLSDINKEYTLVGIDSSLGREEYQVKPEMIVTDVPTQTTTSEIPPLTTTTEAPTLTTTTEVPKTNSEVQITKATEGGNNPGVIIGLIICSGLSLILAVAVICLCVRRRHSASRPIEDRVEFRASTCEDNDYATVDEAKARVSMTWAANGGQRLSQEYDDVCQRP